ncbi:MAG: hypothetical protein GY938_04050, partial [Ketobacter sp.]|nr:hypothetical protein [Ketobacter sp.]
KKQELKQAKKRQKLKKKDEVKPPKPLISTQNGTPKLMESQKTENHLIKEPLINNDKGTKSHNQKTLHNHEDISTKDIEKDGGKEIGQKNHSLKDDEEISIHDDQEADKHFKEKGMQNTMELKELSPEIVAQLQKECQFYKDIITALEEGLSSPEFIMMEGTLYRVHQNKTNPEPNMQLCIPKV